ERERFVVILDANHRRDRPEDLFARDAHIVASLGKERRREIVTVVLPLEPLAAEHERRAFLTADVEIREILIELALIHDRTNVGARRERVVDLERLHLIGER